MFAAVFDKGSAQCEKKVLTFSALPCIIGIESISGGIRYEFIAVGTSAAYGYFLLSAAQERGEVLFHPTDAKNKKLMRKFKRAKSIPSAEEVERFTPSMQKRG